jgi:hypothetical protein
MVVGGERAKEGYDQTGVEKDRPDFGALERFFQRCR